MINKQLFLDHIKSDLFNGSLNSQQITTINLMLDYWDEHFKGRPLSWLAYAFATAYHETNRTFGPIEEYGKGRGKKYRSYYGRGLVQLTWDYNYKKMGDILGLDLINHPEYALVVSDAIPIMFIGMNEGLFTGKAYHDYLNTIPPDYVGARRIINGTDKAKLIAGYATKFESALKASNVPDTPGELKKVSTGFWVVRTTRQYLQYLLGGATIASTLETVRNFFTSWQGMLTIGILFFALLSVLYYVEQRKMKDVKEGRHIPSGVANAQLSP